MNVALLMSQMPGCPATPGCSFSFPLALPLTRSRYTTPRKRSIQNPAMSPELNWPPRLFPQPWQCWGCHPCKKTGLMEGKSLKQLVHQIEWFYMAQIPFPWEGKKSKAKSFISFFPLKHPLCKVIQLKQGRRKVFCLWQKSLLWFFLWWVKGTWS